MTINFYLDTRTKQKEKIIILYLRGLGKTLKFNTGEKIDPLFWDNKKQTAKKTYIGQPELNSYLSAIKEKVKKKIRLLNIDTELITVDKLRKEIEDIFIIKKPIDNKKLFYLSFDQFLLSKKTEIKYRTVQKYNSLKEHLESFEKKKKYSLTFDSINNTFYEKFTAYLIEDKKQTNNTIGKYISCFKTFLKWTIEQNINTNLSFTKFKVYNEKSDIVVLTEKELMNIYYLDLSADNTLEKVRDVFCFQCFTGQRFSDIESLKRKDIKNNSWLLHTYKTKDIIEIPLTQLAKEILSKYENDIDPLPVLSQQKTNEHLKTIGELAELKEPITLVKYSGITRIEKVQPKYSFLSTHTARRTFVTLSLEKGMKADTIMEITGHKSYKTFKKYVKITSKVKHQEMNKYWKKPNHLKVINFK